MLVAACSGGDGKDGAPGVDGADGASALVATSVVEPGDDCVAGGYEVRSGQDADGDGKLSAEETRTTDYVCHGEDGALGSGGAGAAGGVVSLVSVTTLAPDDECKAGGLRLEAGLDTDGSGSLEAGEVTTSRALCHGEPGTAAAQGDPGVDSLIVTHPEAAGDHCNDGGTRIDVGQDADGDAALSEAEISSTSYVCDGATGPTGPAGPTGPSGLASLVVVAVEPAGANCENGGTVITTGLDDGQPSGTAGNGVLEPGEVTAAATTYLCRPAPSLEDLLEAAGEVVSLNLTGTSVSAEFAIVEHLGSESDFVEVASKTGVPQKVPAGMAYTTATLKGRFASKELAELVAWRKALETTVQGIDDLTLTATDLASKKTIATWELADAWPLSLEVAELPSGGDPVVTVELSYSGLTRSQGTTPVVTNPVTLDAGTIDSSCASVFGIGSESSVVTIQNKGGGTTTRPGTLEYYDPVCVRPVDGSSALYDWRRQLESGKTLRQAMILTLPEKSSFQFTNSWPLKSSVDTASNGKLEETFTFVHEGYTQK